MFNIPRGFILTIKLLVAPSKIVYRILYTVYKVGILWLSNLLPYQKFEVLSSSLWKNHMKLHTVYRTCEKNHNEFSCDGQKLTVKSSA